jgi:hypothetical protein
MALRKHRAGPRIKRNVLWLEKILNAKRTPNCFGGDMFPTN